LVNIEITKLEILQNGMEIHFPKGTLEKVENFCLAGCVKEDSILLGFIGEGSRTLKTTDEDTEFFNVQKEVKQ